MRSRRIQFTIQRLIVVIAIFGVCFALLRTPAGVVLFCFLAVFPGFVLPGFLIERAHGGPGIIGGAISVAAISAVVTVALIFYARDFSLDFEVFIGTLVIMTLAAGFAFVFGMVLSSWVYLAFEFVRTIQNIDPSSKRAELES
jgi:hypothetical protein